MQEPTDVWPLRDKCAEHDPRSCEEYVHKLEEACDAGRERACGWLAEELRRGRAVPRDQDRADALFARQFSLVQDACLDDDRRACVQLVEMHREGIGTLADRETAHRLAEDLCSQSDARLCEHAREAEAPGTRMSTWQPDSLLTNCRPWWRWPEPADSPLEAAFRAASQPQLRDFLDEWHTSVLPASDADLQAQPRVVGETYELFRVLYDPRDVSRLGGSQWGARFQGRPEYAVIQEAIHVEVEGQAAVDLQPFRPRIDLGEVRALYADERHATWLKAFLGCDLTDVGEGNIMNPAFPTGRSLARFRFLERLLRIRPNLFGNGWQLETHPLVSWVRFDPTFSRATFAFRVAYEGGTGTAEKADGRWHLRSAGRAWVE